MAKLTMDEYCSLHKEHRSMPTDRIQDIAAMLIAELKQRGCTEEIEYLSKELV